MHGRPREYKNKLKDPKALEVYKKKVDAIRDATTLVLGCRKEKRYDALALGASAKLLKVVPELYTVWNYRREALAPAFDAGGEEAQQAADGELALTQACLQENPKSYSTWHHRKWVVKKGLANLQLELKLVAKALDADTRNFHAWHYRQFVVQLLGLPAEEELMYSEEKIAENFSNYSAWHYRSVMLHKLHCQQLRTVSFEQLMAEAQQKDKQAQQQQEDKQQQEEAARSFQGTASQQRPIPVYVLDQEYDMVHQAFATDSNDQSPWMYYRWLVGNSLAHMELAKGNPQEEEAAGAVLRNVLQREVQRFEEDHISAVPDAKWPLLTVARLMEAQARLGLCEGDAAALLEEVKGIYRRLMEIDPMRKGYYQDAVDGKAFVVVQAIGTV